MCMMLYLASDTASPLIENTQEDRKPLYVRELDGASDDDKFASEYLTKPYKYKLGSWQGCGCGFQFDYRDYGLDDEDNEWGKRSLAALFAYLRANVSGGECDLLSFWSGEDVEHSAVMDLRDLTLDGDSFSFKEGLHIKVLL